MAFVFLVLAFVAGGGLPVQAGLNARLAEWVGGPIRASMISFGLGTVVLFLLALVVTRGVINTDRLGEIPWWAWLGGAVGAGYVASTVAAAPRLGALDHFGVLYREHELSAGRAAGVVLLAAGVAMGRFF